MGAVLAFCALAVMLFAPAGAPAQTSAASQYTPNIGTAGSTATGGKGKGSKNNGGVAGTQDPSGVAGQAVSGGSGDSLAFTGYPLTPLVAIVAILIAAGLMLRVLAPRLDRRRI